MNPSMELGSAIPGSNTPERMGDVKALCARRLLVLRDGEDQFAASQVGFHHGVRRFGLLQRK